MINYQKSFINNQPTLYLVATPIGNLNELTPRAIEVLNQVNCIGAEDTRNTKKLLSHFHINNRMISYLNFNEKQSCDGIIDMMKQGQNIALVSDAGYPLISDPGVNIVNECINNNFNVVPISGANAAINALVASGLPCEPHLYHGFLSSNNNEAKKQLTKLKTIPYTLIFYEAPHRIKRTLKLCLEILDNRQCCIGRELTKKYEEFIRSDLNTLVNELEDLKGEIVLVIDGYKAPLINQEILLDQAYQKVIELIDNGLSTNNAIKDVAIEFNIKKNELYNYYHSK